MLSKKGKNPHVLNGRTDFLVMLIKLPRFINPKCYTNHHAKLTVKAIPYVTDGHVLIKEKASLK